MEVKNRPNIQNQTERPGYKKTKLGWIPSEWETIKLGEIGEFKNSINKRKDDFGFGVPFINLMDVFGKPVLLKDNWGLVNANQAEIENYSLKKGDVLFIRSSVKPSGVGLTSIVKEDVPNTVYSGFLIRYRLDNESIFNNDFLQYCFHEKGFRQRLIVRSSSSANTNINQDNLRQLIIGLPPLTEQQKIAKILSTWDAVIATQEQLITAKETFKKGLMQVLLTGKKRFEGFTDNWREKTLEELGAFFRGKGIKKSEIKDVGIPCIRYAEIYTKYDNYTENFISFIDEYEALKSKEIQNGDLLFAGSGETLEDIGKCVGYLGDVPAFAGGDIIILRQKNQDVKFLGLLLNHDIVNRQTYKLGQGHSVVHIYSSSLKNVKIPLPSIEEQQKIASILSGVDKEIELLKNQLDKLQDQKRGLMQRLLTGQVRVKV